MKINLRKQRRKEIINNNKNYLIFPFNKTKVRASSNSERFLIREEVRPGRLLSRGSIFFFERRSITWSLSAKT